MYDWHVIPEVVSIQPRDFNALIQRCVVSVNHFRNQNAYLGVRYLCRPSYWCIYWNPYSYNGCKLVVAARGCCTLKTKMRHCHVCFWVVVQNKGSVFLLFVAGIIQIRIWLYQKNSKYYWSKTLLHYPILPVSYAKNRKHNWLFKCLRDSLHTNLTSNKVVQLKFCDGSHNKQGLNVR